MLRRTKIVATLGPATDNPKILDEVISAGVDVVRLNMSHGTHEDHERRAEWVRNRARASGRQVGVLIDLQGPKIRCGKFVDGKIDLAPDDRFILDTDWDIDLGNQERVGVTYPSLHLEVARGDTLILNDGLIVLWVDDVQDTEVRCKVVVGGILSNSKGINKLGGGLSAPALTEKDKEDIRFAARIEADYLAVSFVRSAEDVHIARQLLREAGGQGGIVSKIERAEAMDCIEEIVDASDVIMGARGDLGVEIGDAELPAAQKHLI
ncbi:MAG: pyruvate kinase, partial [Sedimenticolaceae bacterium]